MRLAPARSGSSASSCCGEALVRPGAGTTGGTARISSCMRQAKVVGQPAAQLLVRYRVGVPWFDLALCDAAPQVLVATTSATSC
jgi:hypothetical protein